MKKVMNRIIWALCLLVARIRLIVVKRQYPGCEGARNAWPTTGAGSLATGYVASGVTTIRWGSGELVTSINTVATSVTVGIVTRFNQSALVDNMKFPNGNGVSITRVLIVDGMKWDVTVRDDTGLSGTAGIGRPKIGTAVVIVDAAGLVAGGLSTAKYTATVVEGGYDAAPKQPGEMTFTVENLALIESQSAV